jgi:hypothetical protein
MATIYEATPVIDPFGELRVSAQAAEGYEAATEAYGVLLSAVTSHRDGLETSADETVYEALDNEEVRARLALAHLHAGQGRHSEVEAVVEGLPEMARVHGHWEDWEVALRLRFQAHAALGELPVRPARRGGLNGHGAPVLAQGSLAGINSFSGIDGIVSVGWNLQVPDQPQRVRALVQDMTGVTAGVGSLGRGWAQTLVSSGYGVLGLGFVDIRGQSVGRRDPLQLGALVGLMDRGHPGAFYSSPHVEEGREDLNVALWETARVGLGSPVLAGWAEVHDHRLSALVLNGAIRPEGLSFAMTSLVGAQTKAPVSRVSLPSLALLPAESLTTHHLALQGWMMTAGDLHSAVYRGAQPQMAVHHFLNQGMDAMDGYHRVADVALEVRAEVPNMFELGGPRVAMRQPLTIEGLAEVGRVTERVITRRRAARVAAR